MSRVITLPTPRNETKTYSKMQVESVVERVDGSVEISWSFGENDAEGNYSPSVNRSRLFPTNSSYSSDVRTASPTGNETTGEAKFNAAMEVLRQEGHVPSDAPNPPGLD